MSDTIEEAMVIVKELGGGKDEPIQSDTNIQDRRDTKRGRSGAI